MKKSIVLLLFAALTISSLAQKIEIEKFPDTHEASKPAEKYWKLKGITGINASQTQLVNWSAGGESQIAGNIYLNGGLTYHKDKHYWENLLNADYGMLWRKEDGFRKNSDKLEFSTNYGYQIADHWYVSALADLKTQFDKGFNYPNDSVYISKFFAPAYMKVSAGVQYRIEKEKVNFALLLAPVAGRFTFVCDSTLSSQAAFGVDSGKVFRAQIGSYVKARVSADLAKGLNLTSALDLYAPYQKDFTVYVDWEVLLSYQIAKVFTITLSTDLIWNKDVLFFEEGSTEGKPKLQFKEVLGVGVAYAF